MPPAAADSNLLASPSQSSSPSPSVLVVFDFDHSLVNDDSDIFIFKELQPALLLELQDRWPHTQWTQLIDELLQRLALERPELSADDIRQTLARIPVQPRMLDAVRLAVESYGAEFHIVSDANTVFIESMLEHHGLAPLVRKVHTNPSHFETLDGSAADNAKASTCLRVEQYHSPRSPPHGCPHCPVNMCKGRILDAIQRDRAFTHVLYVGDGKGDFCPVTRLASHDMVFAREGAEPIRGPFELLEAIKAQREAVEATVVPWCTGDDIYAHFQAFFASLPRST